MAKTWAHLPSVTGKGRSQRTPKRSRCTLLRAVKDGTVTEEEATRRLQRSPKWAWTAIDPVSKLLLAIDGGERTLVKRVVPQVAQVLVPDSLPLFLTDGPKD